MCLYTCRYNTLLIGIFFLFVEDDPADEDFEPDSETDKANYKVIYLLNPLLGLACNCSMIQFPHMKLPSFYYSG